MFNIFSSLQVSAIERVLNQKAMAVKDSLKRQRKGSALKQGVKKCLGNNETYQLRELYEPYGRNLNPENGVLWLENIHSWSDNH